ncbi:DUF885 domain-containing protein [Pseudohaliea sp.]|uniref:DUF885 domain-containing protein n=1 Tax=Pseudohaliea sp. TaxID=2740289 RepID=UPI0032EF0DFD
MTTVLRPSILLHSLVLMSALLASMAQAESASRQLATIADDYAERLVEQTPYLQMMAGRRVTGLPVETFEQAERNADHARTQLELLEQLDTSKLDHQERLTLAMLSREFQLTIEGLDYFWLSFGLTPYNAGVTLSFLLPTALTTAPLDTAEDVDLYLALLADVGRWLDDARARLEEQARRDIRLPKEALPGARKTFDSLRAGLPALAAVADGRTAGLPAVEVERLQRGIDAVLAQTTLNAVDRLLDAMGAEYESKAPESVGMGQYPDGKAAYRFAIRKQTTMDLDPEVIHQRGLDYLADTQQRMQAIRDRLGFEGTAQDFHEQMRSDPRFFAKTPEEVADRYMAYIRRIEPLIPQYFSVLPAAPYGVKRLDPAAEAGMTFGMYEAPKGPGTVGNYRFNGSNLDERPMVWTAALIYHELIPGHHFHIALQNENTDLDEFRKKTALLYPAYTEGWANYAASLASEMDLLADPYEEYGWLLFDSFLSARLVLDTGMNHFGWSLSKARAFMRENTFSGEAEVVSETLRYSTDMPAQALAYKLGFERIWEIRRAQEQRLGDAFDIRKFHAAVLDSGAMPMPLLEQHVDWYLSH